MPRDKRRLRVHGRGSMDEGQHASKKALKPSSISEVESGNSTITGDTMVLEHTVESSIALSDGKNKISDNLEVVSACKTDECHLSEELVRQAALNFKASVVSLASFNGDTMLVECTGVRIECPKPCNAWYLTSINLVASSDGKRKISDCCTIKVRFTSGGAVKGQLVHYDSYYGFAVVSTSSGHDEVDHTLVLNGDTELQSSSEVIALWSCFSSKKLMAKSGQLIGTPDGKVHTLMFSTCKITMAGIGGPLIDLDGKFVGMNCYDSRMNLVRPRKVITPCLPRDIILKCLECSGILGVGTEKGCDGTTGSSTSKTPESCTHGSFYPEGFFAVNPDTENYLKETAKYYGYPSPDPIEEDMYVINTCEKEFDNDTWIKLRKDIASKISRSVVALASFNGAARFFACTGVFIGNSKCSKTILTAASLVRTSGHNNLTIEVHLTNKRRAVGKLTYCNFDYNIALVRIDESIPLPTIELQQPPVKTGTRVSSVGCLFDGCRLMATDGVVTESGHTLGSSQLCLSTCKTTKAGIGGPLIDKNGKFVGMNFYGEEETPFLPASTLLKILGGFHGKWPEGDAKAIGNADQGGSDRWKVSEPKWVRPDRMAEPLMEHFVEEY